MVDIATNYVQVADVKDYLGIDIDNLDASLQNACAAASRSVDDMCGRRFFKDGVASKRIMNVQSFYGVSTPDIADITGLTVETSYDRSLWQLCSGYHAVPDNAPWKRVEAWPWTGVVSDILWPRPIPTFLGPWARVNAVWGWPEVPAAVFQSSLILAARTWKRADSPTGIESFSDTARRILSNDPDVCRMLSDYVAHDSADSFS